MLKCLKWVSQKGFAVSLIKVLMPSAFLFARMAAISWVGFFCFSSSPSGAQENAALREFELFNQGYESYLAYQPDRAVETLRSFIREFPGSSAEDAALFWLGKALSQVNAHQEALQVFSEIRQKYPVSPYISYVNNEIDLISSKKKEGIAVGGGTFDAVKPVLKEEKTVLQPALSEKEKASGSDDKKPAGPSHEERDAQASKVRETEQALAAARGELEKISEERQRMKLLYEEEKKRNTEELAAKTAEIERRDAEMQVILAKSRQEGREDEQIRLIKERDELRERLREYEENAITVRDRKYTANQILDYLIISSSVLFKLGIKDVLWASGNMYDDFVADQILFDEAQKIFLEEVKKKSRELSRLHNFSNEEQEYLFRFLAIRELVQQRMSAVTDKESAEMLVISFTAENKGEKVLLAAEVQRIIRAGKSFGALEKELAGEISVKNITAAELPDWVAEKYRSLRYNEISDILWTEQGFIVIRKTAEDYQPTSLEDASPEFRQRLKKSLREWVAQIR